MCTDGSFLRNGSVKFGKIPSSPIKSRSSPTTTSSDARSLSCTKPFAALSSTFKTRQKRCVTRLKYSSHNLHTWHFPRDSGHAEDLWTYQSGNPCSNHQVRWSLRQRKRKRKRIEQAVWLDGLWKISTNNVYYKCKYVTGLPSLNWSAKLLLRAFPPENGVSLLEEGKRRKNWERR